MALTWSAILGAVARLRPILMTSLAMIVGLLPLMFASGVGANGNSTLGASTVGGMLIGDDPTDLHRTCSLRCLPESPGAI